MKMKSSTKEAEKVIWDSMRSPNSVVTTNAQSRGLPKLMLWLIFFVSVTYVVYTLKLVANPSRCPGTGEEEENPLFSSLRRRHNYHRISTSGEGVLVSTVDHKVESAATLQQLGGLGRRKNNIALPTTTSLNTESSGGTFPLATAKNELFELFRSRKSKSSSSSSSYGLSSSQPAKRPVDPPTNISHIVFGIGASSKLWPQRKNYIKIWYKPKTMRGVVWLDTSVPNRTDENLPELKISNDTSKFAYKNKQGHRSAIRISRIISETLRLGLKDVRWFVLGDDDTVFVTDNLVRVLSKYDHNQYYYIGSSSESHLQNIYFSYAMAYGGGGFAISYPLAVALEQMQDRCIQRYPGLYGSDDRMQACMAELGVPLTKELGFHQYDVYGNLFGLLAAHPVAPLVSLHHLDVVEPIFPDATRAEALRRLTVPMRLDSAGLMQQSICYDSSRKWTVSVSWGFAVQIIRGVLSPREMEMPTRTFLNWYKRADYTAYAFNTRPVARNPCQKPFVFYLSKASLPAGTNSTLTKYVRHRVPHPLCKWKKIEDPSSMELVTVNKRPDPQLWERSPRRNCCRVVKSKKPGSMVIDVGLCNAGEVTEV